MNEVEFYLNGVKSSLQEISERIATDKQILALAAGCNDLALEMLLRYERHYPRFFRKFCVNRSLKNWHVIGD